MMSDDLDIRRRRCAWRASHRGTKELDLLIGTYAAARLAAMDAGALDRFEAFLAAKDPELQAWLLAPSAAVTADFADLIADVRRFHGLET